MKIAVVGPGAIGCLFSGLLGESGHDVWLLDMDPGRARSIAGSGIRIDDKNGSRIVPVNATASSSAIGQAPIVFLCVKSYDTAQAVRSIPFLVGPETIVVSLQNGFGNVERIAELVDREKIACAITAYGSTSLGQGHVRHAGSGTTQVSALLLDAADKAELVAAFLAGCGIETRVVSDIESMIWSKLVINAAINPLTAVSGVRNGQLLEDDELKEAMKRTVQEAASVARAERISLMYEDEVEEVEKVCRVTKDNISSMLQDVRKGRQTEIDAINGIIVKRGRELGIDVPSNEILLDSVKKIEETNRK